VAESIQPLFGSREKRIAFNEAKCRDFNKAQWMKGYSAGGFRCECWQLDCTARFPLSGREWHQVRSWPNRFAVAPGHLAPDVEVVVERYPHFWLVEKLGEAGEVAESLE
jgi:hypothetical protein